MGGTEELRRRGLIDKKPHRTPSWVRDRKATKAKNSISGSHMKMQSIKQFGCKGGITVE
jgi:hypothetical protein